MKSKNFRRNVYFRLVSSVLFILILLIGLEVTGLRSEFTIINIQKLFENNLIKGSLFFILSFALGNLAGIPGGVFLAAAIYALGKSNGYLLTTFAAIISCLNSFLIIRLIGGDGLRQIDNRFAKKLLEKLDKRPITINILLRLVFQTVPPLNYTLALSGVRFRDYFLGVILGLPLPLLVITLLFDYFIKFLK